MLNLIHFEPKIANYHHFFDFRMTIFCNLYKNLW